MPTKAFLVASEFTGEEIALLLARNPEIQIFVYTQDYRYLAAIPEILQDQGLKMTEMVQIGVSRLNSKGTFDREDAPWLVAAEK